MAKLFNTIRKKIVTEKPSVNRTTNYLKYAIGEIILVVIGILIALSINNWNQKRKDKIISIIYLENIKKELTNQINNLQKIHISRFDRKIKGLKLAKQYHDSNIKIKDTLTFLTDVTFGAVGSTGIEKFNQSVFETLKSTGNIGLIKSELRNKIMNHYDYSNVISSLSYKQGSNYLKLINSLRPFNPNSPRYISKKDQIKILKAIKTEAFIRQVNLELSNAYHNHIRVKNIKERANSLIKSIDQYLDNN